MISEALAHRKCYQCGSETLGPVVKHPYVILVVNSEFRLTNWTKWFSSVLVNCHAEQWPGKLLYNFTSGWHIWLHFMQKLEICYSIVSGVTRRVPNSWSVSFKCKFEHTKFESKRCCTFIFTSTFKFQDAKKKSSIRLLSVLHDSDHVIAHGGMNHWQWSKFRPNPLRVFLDELGPS